MLRALALNPYTLKLCSNYQWRLTASPRKMSERAPFHLGSVSGNNWPMSGRHRAPRTASVMVWSSTSPAWVGQAQVRYHYSMQVFIQTWLAGWYRLVGDVTWCTMCCVLWHHRLLV